MTKLKITAGPYEFDARLETQAAPQTCKAFMAAMPYTSQLVHVRWSGEGVWIPLGDFDFGVGYENHTSHPAPGHFILYPKECKPVRRRKWARDLSVSCQWAAPWCWRHAPGRARRG